MDFATAESLYREAAAMPGIEILGVASHIGSQLLDISPLLESLDKVLGLIERLQAAGIRLRHIDVGGGLGVRYKDEVAPLPSDWAAALLPRLAGRGLRVLTEPGRAIAANAGLLVTRVEAIKDSGEKHFAVIDAAMNDLIRPTLYQAWMDIVPVTPRDGATQEYDLVGPVCETTRACLGRHVTDWRTNGCAPSFFGVCGIRSRCRPARQEGRWLVSGQTFG